MKMEMNLSQEIPEVDEGTELSTPTFEKAPKRTHNVDAAHTPGPWMYRPNLGSTKEDWTFHIDRQGTPGRMNWGVLIAACWGHVSESAEANARLIAAAPALYEALKAVLAMSDRGGKPYKLDEALTWRANDEKARAMADAALTLVDKPNTQDANTPASGGTD